MYNNNQNQMYNIHGYYINLSKRDDRRTFFEKQRRKYRLLVNLNRFEAIENENGALGCSLSHYKLLESLYNGNNKQPYYLVCEDDFEIFNDKNYASFYKSFKSIQTEDWDVITLTPRGKTDKNFKKYNTRGFARIYDTQTTSGYIIKHNFIPQLMKHFKMSIDSLTNCGSVRENACDIVWKKIQTESKFIYYNKLFARQLPGYSNIENKMVDYSDRFLKQNYF